MSDMGLVVVGAAGRMGQTLIRTIHTMRRRARCRRRSSAPGSPHLGKDAGELAGVGVTRRRHLTDDPLPAFAKADGVLDFTMPAATVEFAGYAAQARIVHVIGTTGCGPDDDAKIAAAARHATIVKSGNMSLGVNLLAVLVEQAAQGARPARLRHRDPGNASPPQGRRAVRHGAAARRGGRRGPRASSLAENSVRVRDGHTGARPGRRDRLRHAARRLGGRRASASSLPAPASASRCRTMPRTAHLRPRRGQGSVWGRDKKPGLYSMRDVLGL